jgi:hypothetical protein
VLLKTFVRYLYSPVVYLSLDCFKRGGGAAFGLGRDGVNGRAAAFGGCIGLLVMLSILSHLSWLAPYWISGSVAQLVMRVVLCALSRSRKLSLYPARHSTVTTISIEAVYIDTASLDLSHPQLPRLIPNKQHDQQHSQ